jgi:plastocyanin
MPLRTLVAVALGICAIAGLVTAIADKGRDGSTAPAASAASRPAASKQATAFRGRTLHVQMRRLAFSPHTVRLRLGDRVIWHNADTVGHNVTTQEDPAGTILVDLRSPTIPVGGSYTYVARHLGAATYVCTIHPTTMVARIVVAGRA